MPEWSILEPEQAEIMLKPTINVNPNRNLQLNKLLQAISLPSPHIQESSKYKSTHCNNLRYNINTLHNLKYITMW